MEEKNSVNNNNLNLEKILKPVPLTFPQHYQQE